MNVIEKIKDKKFKVGDKVIVEGFKKGRQAGSWKIGDICIVDKLESKDDCISVTNNSYCNKSSLTQCIRIYNQVRDTHIWTCSCRIRRV